jgi:glycosyltransferase involved in cell wall biosynthesis
MTHKKKHGQSESPEGDVQYSSRNPRVGQHVGVAGLVSVVIPCYNQAHFLGETIQSVFAQSYPRFEVVVVDDGSTDDTSEVAARYPGVRCVRQDNQGVSAARNSGLLRSEGEYAVFLDADDRLLPGALEAGLECLRVHPRCAFASGRYRFIAGDGSFLKEQRVVNRLVAHVWRVRKHPVEVDYHPAAEGDVRCTWADLERAERELGYQPRVGLEEGIEAQVEWALREELSSSRG